MTTAMERGAIAGVVDQDLDVALAALRTAVADAGDVHAAVLLADVAALARALTASAEEHPPPATGTVGVRYLPPIMECPNRPGRLNVRELKSRRRGWAASALRRRVVALIERGICRCATCGATEDLVCDHIVPLTWGGTNDPENLQILCWSCNVRKGEMLPANSAAVTA